MNKIPLIEKDGTLKVFNAQRPMTTGFMRSSYLGELKNGVWLNQKCHRRFV